MLELLLIAVICVIIIDISGVIESIKSGIKRLLTNGRMSDPNYSLKPLDCSFCITFWTGLVYLLCIHSVSLWMLTYLLLICVMTPVIRGLIVLIRDLFIKILNYVL